MGGESSPYEIAPNETPVLLLICYVLVCHLSRYILNPTIKEWISTIFGVFVLCMGCGSGVFHLITCFLVNALLILYGNKRYLHLLCFSFSMLNISILHFDQSLGLPTATRYTRAAFMVMFLKMVQLSLDVQESFTKKTTEDHCSEKRNDVCRTLTGVRLFHFAMAFVHVFVMMRYRTYHDWIHTPCRSHDLCSKEAFATFRKLLLMYFCFIFPSTYFFPPEYIMADDFYKRSLTYRFLYALLVGTTVRWTLYFLMGNADLHRALAGLGLYPVATNPKPGEGPTENLHLLEEIKNNPQLYETLEYNLEATKNADVIDSEFTSITFRKFWRSYNCVDHYFFAVNVYRHFKNKRLGLYATFFVSGWWHDAGLALLVGFVYTALYIDTEDIWMKLYRHGATGVSAKLLDSLFLISRFICHSFVLSAMGLFIRDGKPGYRFIESFNFIPLFYPLAMYALGTALTYVKSTPNVKKGL